MKEFLKVVRQNKSEGMSGEEQEVKPENSGIRAPIAPIPDLNGKISILIGRMYRFARFYVKKAMEKQAVTTLDDFTFLATIFRSGSPTKSEVCADNITEITTGMEILRRLQKLGLIEEYTDEHDRRVKRVKLTEAGTFSLFGAFAAMKPVSTIVAGRLQQEQKEQLLSLLIELDLFHSNIYAEQRQENLDELLTKNLDVHQAQNE